MKTSIVNAADFYKYSHDKMYPNGTTKVYSTWIPRSTRIPDIKEVVVFGVQYFIKKYLMEEWSKFFSAPREEAVNKHRRLAFAALGPNSVNLQKFYDLHDLGYLPIEIKAVEEGKKVPIGVAQLSIASTDERFYWLPNYLESLMSCTLWGMSTSATTAHEFRKVLRFWAEKTSDDLSFVDFQGHDFSFRGMFGYEAACMSGSGHLLSFKGTDTGPAITFLEDYYNADLEKESIGHSVSASEHAVMSAGGCLPDEELETLRRLLFDVFPDGILSVVSDTFDFWNLVTSFLPILKSKIMNRDGKLVIRPDSGIPAHVLAGYRWTELNENSCEQFLTDLKENPKKWEVVKVNGKYFRFSLKADSYNNDNFFGFTLGQEVPEHEVFGLIQVLWNIFGGIVNSKGYKVLDSRIGAIYGDSITREVANETSERLVEKGFASTNVVYGIGSFSYQHVTRDTYGFAMKATYCEINGQGRDIFKAPKADSSKRSPKGRLYVGMNEDGTLFMEDQVSTERELHGELKTVFKNGKLLVDHTLVEIRERLNIGQ